ncbi:efflux RND transporter periplasmic adaptor subunit [Zoogloea oleivorans]|uniref:Efflux RND transporter periplasmic adaptor subunit n=2 Tax=Zoogloea oleivorans TaxID=1552750 RepID=A0A6C2CKK9_9RHOO|nr:efflux RND transporter periplasmic adaptor subunit [Zoogloea oleivorans]
MHTAASPMPAAHRPPLHFTFAAAALALAFSADAASPDFIPVSATQSQALGIVTQRVSPAGTAAASGLPAMVSIPNSQVRVIAAPLAGVVESLETAPGQNVKKGQLLARIASPQALELQRDRLQADAQAGLARQTLNRDEQLFREGLIAESRVQASRANAAQNAAQAAERRQALALAQYSGGQTLSLLAPIAGSVLEQSVNVGQRVEQAAPLYRIARLDPLSVEIQAPLAIASQAKIGTLLRIPAAGASGEVVAVGRAVDPATQSVLLRGLITRGAQNLRPGQATAVDLEVNAAGTSAVQVPAGSVLHQQGKQWVFVSALDGKTAGYRALPVGITGKLGEAMLVSGVPADALVVTAGVAALKASWLGIGKE